MCDCVYVCMCCVYVCVTVCMCACAVCVYMCVCSCTSNWPEDVRDLSSRVKTLLNWLDSNFPLHTSTCDSPLAEQRRKVLAKKGLLWNKREMHAFQRCIQTWGYLPPDVIRKVQHTYTHICTHIHTHIHTHTHTHIHTYP